ncbi:hypothetical protein RFI_00554 [Reticulomyxa filosa]|uniref:Uncharacterized protein n=1 Tax=Reticulomyxa filosa TaxID=46433 RepID=X6PE66_RETFI|nr:hypothetical protein RFI_00554 [Reticulomyxa filosa]|eukprot:ETO36506.1 hypothetical protein RFI_00554 [Reticulomyxa filosa]
MHDQLYNAVQRLWYFYNLKKKKKKEPNNLANEISNKKPKQKSVKVPDISTNNKASNNKTSNNRRTNDESSNNKRSNKIPIQLTDKISHDINPTSEFLGQILYQRHDAQLTIIAYFIFLKYLFFFFLKKKKKKFIIITVSVVVICGAFCVALLLCKRVYFRNHEINLDFHSRQNNSVPKASPVTSREVLSQTNTSNHPGLEVIASTSEVPHVATNNVQLTEAKPKAEEEPSEADDHDSEEEKAEEYVCSFPCHTIFFSFYAIMISISLIKDLPIVQSPTQYFGILLCFFAECKAKKDHKALIEPNLFLKINDPLKKKMHNQKKYFNESVSKFNQKYLVQK